jgi:hypothetical protein
LRFCEENVARASCFARVSWIIIGFVLLHFNVLTAQALWTVQISFSVCFIFSGVVSLGTEFST